jgi:hypothetical protein
MKYVCLWLFTIAYIYTCLAIVYHISFKRVRQKLTFDILYNIQTTIHMCEAPKIIQKYTKHIQLHILTWQSHIY